MFETKATCGTTRFAYVRHFGTGDGRNSRIVLVFWTALTLFLNNFRNIVGDLVSIVTNRNVRFRKRLLVEKCDTVFFKHVVLARFEIQTSITIRRTGEVGV